MTVSVGNFVGVVEIAGGGTHEQASRSAHAHIDAVLIIGL
jgi:hypothetical protein